MLLVQLGAALSRQERVLVGVCYAAHMLSAVAQVWLHESYYEGTGDMLTYFRAGAMLSRLLEIDFARWLPELVRLAAHVEHDIPFPVVGSGSSSGTMGALSTVLVYLFGLSPTLICLVVSTSSALSQVFMHRTARTMFPESMHLPVATGMLLVPSVIFWSSAFTKEAIAFPFLALLLHGGAAIAKRSWLRGVATLAMGAGGVGLVKPYILVPFILAAAAAAYAAKNARAGQGKGPSWLYGLGAMAIIVVGLAAISAIFPDFSPQALSDKTAQNQASYIKMDAIGLGGSNIDLDEFEDRSLGAQLKLVPLAAVNSLLRPFLFEARSSVLFAAAIESTIILVLMLRLFRGGGRLALRRLLSSPPLAFSAVFVVTFGIAVGLNTLNLGTLSRYRIPMMPFFVVLLVGLGHERTDEESDEASDLNSTPSLGPSPHAVTGREARRLMARERLRATPARSARRAGPDVSTRGRGFQR